MRRTHSHGREGSEVIPCPLELRRGVPRFGIVKVGGTVAERTSGGRANAGAVSVGDEIEGPCGDDTNDSEHPRSRRWQRRRCVESGVLVFHDGDPRGRVREAG